MPGEKPTRAEKAQRVGRVYELLMAAVSRGGILQYFANPRQPDGSGGMGLDLAARTVDGYIAEATALILTEGEVDRGDERKLTKARLSNLYARNMARGDLYGARLVLADIRKMAGLDEPTKFQHGGDRDNPITIEVAEVTEALVDQMIAIATQGYGGNQN